MAVRTRLVLAFAYVLITVIVALTVPLAVTLRDRAQIESEAQALSSAQTFASSLDRDDLQQEARLRLRNNVDQFASQIPEGRVVVLDAEGTVVADSDGSDLHQNYANGQRPEVEFALGDPPSPMSRRAGATRSVRTCSRQRRRSWTSRDSWVPSACPRTSAR
jgi:sensor histidine kinase regulating citrate/malate metabolism